MRFRIINTLALALFAIGIGVAAPNAWANFEGDEINGCGLIGPGTCPGDNVLNVDSAILDGGVEFSTDLFSASDFASAVRGKVSLNVNFYTDATGKDHLTLFITSNLRDEDNVRVAVTFDLDPITLYFSDFDFSDGDFIANFAQCDACSDPVLQGTTTGFTADSLFVQFGPLQDVTMGPVISAACPLDKQDTGCANSAIYARYGITVGVPEPASLMLLGIALVGLGLMRRRHVQRA